MVVSHGKRGNHFHGFGKQREEACIQFVRGRDKDGIGAVVRITSAGGSQWSMVRSGSSYCSQSDLALTFGLAKDTQVSAIEIAWPSGQTDRIANVAANQHVLVEEGKGIVPPNK